jgi:hypothetical protein
MSIPCKNCLTFPICKSQAMDVYRHIIYLNFLFNKCSLFRDHCQKVGVLRTDSKLLNINSKAYIDIIKCFTEGNQQEYEKALSVIDSWEKNVEW